MTEEQPKALPLSGYQIELEGGRKVWAGNHLGSWFFRFDDGKGCERCLRLSYEATDALVKLVTQSPKEIYRFIVEIDPPTSAIKGWKRLLDPKDE